jgi:hypothetical protein
MSDTPNSQSRKKAKREEQIDDKGTTEPEPLVSGDKPPEPGAASPGEIEPQIDGEEYTEDYPDWLLNLESKSVDVPMEAVFQGGEAGPEDASQGPGAGSKKLPEEDLPDWLLENYTPTPPAEKEKAPDYEIPDWLQTSLDELSVVEEDTELLPATPEPQPEPPLSGDIEASQAAEPSAEPGEPAASKTIEPADLDTLLSLVEDESQPTELALGDEGIFTAEAEEADEYFLEGIPPAPTEPQSIESLDEVRLSLKDGEQEKPKKERPGLVELLTGWMLASSHVQQQRMEQRLESQMGQEDSRPSLEASPEAAPDAPTDQESGFLGDAVAGAVLFEAASAADESSELEPVDFEPEEESTGSAETVDEALPNEQESLGEAPPERPTPPSDQIPGMAEEEKEKRGFLGGLFGLKKADQGEEIAISDEEVERRLLIALGVAGLEETPAPVEPEPAQEAPEPGPPVQDEETDFLLWDEAEYEDVESVLFKDEPYLTEVEESSQLEGEQPVEEESLETEELVIPGEKPKEGPAGDNFMELREVALQDYVEPEPPTQGPVNMFLQDAVQQTKEFSLGQKLALATLIIMNLALVCILGVIFLFNLLQLQVNLTPVPVEPTPLPAIAGPFPVQVTLPGGWSFDLKQGTLKDGIWQNEGAEWLRGTEITRWVALPWSEQLEAVVVTLGPEDQIELTLSNQDRQKYKVDAVIEVPVEKVAELNLDRPSLILILANRGADTRVVVTASLAENE